MADENQVQPQRAVVVDVQMPFTSMVVFMVKWTIASIPALIILFALGLFAVVVVASIGRGLGAGMTSIAAATLTSPRTVVSANSRGQGMQDKYVPPQRKSGVDVASESALTRCVKGSNAVAQAVCRSKHANCLAKYPNWTDRYPEEVALLACYEGVKP